MCVICTEWQMGKLTSKEAMRNLGEILVNAEDEQIREHLFDLSNKIIDSEFPETLVNEELDSKWWQETHEDVSKK